MKTRHNKELWWTVRILSALIIAFSLYMFLGHISNYSSSNPMEVSSIVGLSISGLGLLGLALAWKWELIGGVIALASFITIGIMEPVLFTIPWLYIFPLSAVLFIILWNKNKKELEDEN